MKRADETGEAGLCRWAEQVGLGEKFCDLGILGVSFPFMKSLLSVLMNPSFARFSALRLFSLSILVALLPASAAAANIKVWVLLMQNPDEAQSIISNNPSEKDGLLAAGWRLSGVGLTETEAGANRGLLHRMLKMSPSVQRRLAVTSGEVAANEAAGFVSEGALGQVELKAEPGYVPVHGFAKGERTIWVVDHHDQYWADKNGWKRTGAIFWLRPAANR
jgi:hypothetical protein